MNILLDENLDWRLRHDLPGHTVESVPLIGWGRPQERRAAHGGGKALRRVTDDGQQHGASAESCAIPHRRHCAQSSEQPPRRYPTADAKGVGNPVERPTGDAEDGFIIAGNFAGSVPFAQSASQGFDRRAGLASGFVSQ